MPTEELKIQIMNWLKTQGYGTEMKVAKSLINRGFEVRQSDFYIDPDQQISREIDIYARLIDQIGFLGVFPVIECKKSTKPWVLFTSENIPYNRLHSLAIMSKQTQFVLIDKFSKLVENDLVKKHGRLAYGITEAFTSKGDETFKAALSATKAAIAKLIEDQSEHNGNFLNFYFPTVVLDGPLFECYLSESGSQIIEEVDNSFLLFSHKTGNYFGSSVRIITLASIEKYCSEIKELFELLRIVLKPDIISIGKSMGLSEKQMENETEM